MKLIKRSLLLFTLTITTSFVLTSCNDDDSSEMKFENNKNNTTDLVNRLSNGKITLLEEKNISSENKLLLNRSSYNGYDYHNGKEVYLKDDKNNIIKVSTFYNKSTNNLLSIIEKNNDIKYIEYSQSIDENGNLKFSLLNENTVQSRGKHDGWWGCMTNAFSDKEFNTIVGILGAAGGAGCAPCGMAGGALVGVVALGCLG